MKQKEKVLDWFACGQIFFIISSDIGVVTGECVYLVVTVTVG